MLVWLKSLANLFKTEPLSEGSSLFQNEEYKDMWLFVGLGNPGREYERNRHNVGFMVMDAVQREFPVFGSFKSKFQGNISEGRLGNQKALLLKPETYMNNSGQSVSKAMKFYKIEPERVIVFHDELDIAPSAVRIKQGGGNAGHNGLKSIQAHLGTADFWRVRIGIGRPHPQADVSNYVLDNFSKAEQKWLEPLVDYMGYKADVIVSDSPKEYGSLIKEHFKK